MWLLEQAGAASDKSNVAEATRAPERAASEHERLAGASRCCKR
ncbi:hypothetical protein [Cohnella hashimotonis]|uniref:Uncharacterized protein n=1 Tax=Cohnella hashimotonis TaxID=2826895 RepID=A0ABT6TWJ3_9BACL|nr:hypothetical protein [Cohnella hashimotonis]MDI4650187.1 hypothetical protein [Cohnella hashimotonis]